ncbi:hypothetical protein H6G88_05650 [Bifidobacterium ruminantium]|uniref:DUF3322 and DUF2220 domain-containing protein n=1 Tax=Bifidobacterium ruminantium TaxID=78346 RepID=UPI0019591210|nr:DUF3322 and DUF2220 domain-containing protein [Bifidobacterium ruminantium]MBM6746784.1 hypothetical protein [Bifidobacterium ruminantium]
MAKARNAKDGMSIRRELDEYVDAHLNRHMYDTEVSWPLRKTIRLPKQAELEDNYARVRAQDDVIRDWANRHQCETSEKTKIVSSGIVRQKSQLVDSVIIPDLDTALRIATRTTRERYLRERQRMRELADEFGISQDSALNVAKTLKNHDDVDFRLVIQAAHYFTRHDCHTMTPRMVPIPGFSAKWLGTPNSQRRKAICMLTGQDNLDFQERPGELRLRFMDTEHHGQPDLIITQPWIHNRPTDIAHAIIIENKDTYQAMPTAAHAICIFGSGYATLKRMTTLLPWVTDIPDIIYWGDMDADGLDILSKLRQTGIPCASLLMDPAAYRAYERYGTMLDTKNKPLTTRESKPTPQLTSEERGLYEMLCTGTNATYLRIEQERIPIADAAAILHDQYQWPIAMPDNTI